MSNLDPPDLNKYKLITYNLMSPDGEDCAKKTLHSAKAAGYIGFMFGCYDVIGVTKPQGAHLKAARLFAFTAFPAAVGAVYATTSCLCGDFRKKDDWVNHTIGGITAGVVVGAKFNKPVWGMTCSLILGFLGGISKALKPTMGSFMPEPERVEEGWLGQHNRYYGPKVLQTKATEPTNY